ncbi:MAG: peptide deformylase [SAR324 cluster bacterium]|nr:peptide deformylase [SAR324 cluster bacterium]
MALLTVLTFPHPVLKHKAETIEVFDHDLEKLSENMLATMYDSEGIGLAANQVGILKRIVVVDIFSGDEDKSNRDPHVFVNPRIIERSGEILTEEGCLSVIDFTAEVKRSQKIVLEYQDVKGNSHCIEAEDLKAICIQHEIDHLDGILFIDHLSPLKQSIVKKKLTKLAKKSA